MCKKLTNKKNVIHLLSSSWGNTSIYNSTYSSIGYETWRTRLMVSSHWIEYIIVSHLTEGLVNKWHQLGPHSIWNVLRYQKLGAFIGFCYYYFFISSCLPFWDRYGFFLVMSSATIFSLVRMGTLVERCFLLIRMSLGCFGVTLDYCFVLTSTVMETCSSVLE